MRPSLISHDDAHEVLSWPEAVDALRDGHRLPKAEMRDLLFGPPGAVMLSRAARIEGIGYGVKAESVFESNAAIGLPNTHGAVLLYAADTGVLRAVIEARCITDLKTAADSVLGATLLARPDSRELVIVGAGAVAANLAHAYSALFPALERISIWARRPDQAQALCAKLATLPVAVRPVTDLPAALASADIVSSATPAQQPVLRGGWIRPGTHVDLIGAFTAQMREADDALIASAQLYVDSHETTRHIGEIAAPIASGAIPSDHVIGDLYDLVGGQVPLSRTPETITAFKNGGGAHFDLMIADRLLKKLGL
ncbi:ornithine cyclodeaminase [Burkholderia sp. SRS-W-2-2016]|uniref:ornithine cyclodeaminase family protein n=1 Tax=Burkholderia sp. SRS-W-2-2016 TaxID=1926878 RepID=UPI00094B5A78|nr:ornithine cyclodeaminase [Burkholderia sp. SRS-W-2-2016]OLL27404.1 ornithine cyclodeaminase [Burkholderia sp. SRS-W-2-2016]